MKINFATHAISLCGLVWLVGCQPSTPAAAPNAPAVPAAAANATAPEQAMPPDAAPVHSTNNTNNSPTPAESTPAMKVAITPFGTTPDGQKVSLYTMQNDRGLTLKLTDYGATIVSLEAHDRDGKLANVALGFDKLDGYLDHTAYFGCAVGRYANRIALGKFTLGGKDYTLATNNGPNHLHGGVAGFNRKLWKAEPIEGQDLVGVRFSYRSPDGEEGYPGNLDAEVTYTLNYDNDLTMDYSAQTDQATVLNLTNHCYWNLGGAGSGSILEHELIITGDKYVEADENLIPTGNLADALDTPMDFTKPRTIGSQIKELTNVPQGYDHCYVLATVPGKLVLAARVRDPKSGRVMEVHTTQPGVQLYTGNFLDGDAKNGGHKQHTAFCLETQHFPDSPNQPEFPSTVLRPGEQFRQTTVHKFRVE